MNFKNGIAIAIVVVLGIGSVGCAAGSKMQPRVSSDSTSRVVALESPARMKVAIDRLTVGVQQLREAIGAFQTYPDELEDPPWDLVEKIVAQALEAGQRRDVVEQIRRHRDIDLFIEVYSGELGWRLESHAAAAGRAASCGCAGKDSAGALRYGLKESTGVLLERARLERNEAHITITGAERALGKKNTKALRAQVDSLTLSSFFVHVDAIESGIELERLLSEQGDLRETLEGEVEAERAILASQDTQKGDRKESERRFAEAEGAIKALDEAVAQGKQVMAKLEKELLALEDDYDKAVEALMDKIKEKRER